jgi:hypothetical protein
VIDHLSAGQRRIAALALLGFFSVLLWMAVMRPLIGMFQTRAEGRQADLRALSRDRALLTQAPRIRDALVSIDQNPRWSRFYESPKPDKALVQLESDLREIFKAPNNPTSMTARPATTKGPLTQLVVKVTLSMPIDQWTESLGRLQGHPRLLLIDSLTIQAPDYQVVDSNPTLSIQAEIVGFVVTSTGART